jgi:hypothetical protein
MTYVEYLRVRHALVVYAAIVAAIAFITLIITLFGGGNVEVDTHGSGAAASHVMTHTTVRAAVSEDFRRSGHTIPISALLVLAGYAAVVMASIFGMFLSRERLHVPVSWTKPVSREWFALAYLGVDVAAVVVAFLVFFAGELVVTWGVGVAPFLRSDVYVGAALLLMSGMALAYYGIVRAICAAFPSQAGAIAGGSWGVFFALMLLAAAPLPRIAHAVIIALNFLNPLAYLSHVDESHSGGILPVTGDAGAALVWLLAIVAMALSVVLYRRPEA